MELDILPSARQPRVGLGPELLLQTMPWCTTQDDTHSSNSDAYAESRHVISSTQPLYTVIVTDVHLEYTKQMHCKSGLQSELHATVAEISIQASETGCCTGVTAAAYAEMRSMLRLCNLAIDSTTEIHSLQLNDTVQPNTVTDDEQADDADLATPAVNMMTLGVQQVDTSVKLATIAAEVEPVVLGRLAHLGRACSAALAIGREEQHSNSTSVSCYQSYNDLTEQSVVINTEQKKARGASLSPAPDAIANQLELRIGAAVLDMRYQASRDRHHQPPLAV